MNSFRVTIYDPALIIGQILCLQSIFYSTETFLMFLCSYNHRPSLNEVFNLQVLISTLKLNQINFRF